MIAKCNSCGKVKNDMIAETRYFNNRLIDVFSCLSCRNKTDINYFAGKLVKQRRLTKGRQKVKTWMVVLLIICIAGCGENPNYKYITLRVTDVWLARRKVLEEDKAHYTVEWGGFRHRVSKDGIKTTTFEDMSAVDYIQYVPDGYWSGKKEVLDAEDLCNDFRALNNNKL